MKPTENYEQLLARFTKRIVQINSKTASTPQEMEKEAADIAKYRGLAAENARLKQQQVPSQQLDNNQPSPSATGNEDQLLDRYIGGDRSPEAVSAAQRLLNLS